MQRRLVKTEVWLTVQGWPYEVSSYGHIRRKRSKQLINPWWDKDGYGTVILQSGPRKAEFYLDSLIASSFTGRRVNGVRPLHLNGLPWDNFAKHLTWGIGSLPYENMTNLVTNWTVWSRGKLQHGPFTDWSAVRAAASREGDIIIGRNPKREIVAYQVMFSRNQSMSPANPFDLVRKYKALADAHPNHSWSYELSEAAQVILALASNIVNEIPSPARAAAALENAANGKAPDAPQPVGRRALPPVAPIARRSLAPPAASASVHFPIAPKPAVIPRRQLRG